MSNLFDLLSSGGEEELVSSHQPCSDCGSSDALAVYTGHTYCFSCGKYTNKQTDDEVVVEEVSAFSKGKYGSIADRKLSKDTVKFFEVGQILDDKGVPIKHIYPYYKGNVVIAQKIRNIDTKTFYFEGSFRQAGLFGQQLFPAAKKQYIIVTEGELDAMAAYQMLQGIYPCVSVNNGAAGSLKNLKDHMEYLNTFKTIVLCFDNDEVGQEAAKRAAKLFPAGKVKIFQSSPKYKDACDYLVAGQEKEFVQAIYDSPTYRPSGIMDIVDLKDRFLERKRKLVQSNLNYPWEGLNALTYGLRTGEFVIFTAETGVGKTSIVREIQNHLINTSDVKIGVMYIEEPVEDTYGRTLGLELNEAIHLPTVDVDEAKLLEAGKKIGRDRVYVYEHFGSSGLEEIVERIRYFASALGCKIIILDHISMLVSDQRHLDERKALDEISTKLKQLTVELDIAILAIAHLNREGEIRGSANIEKLANIIIRAERDLLDENPLTKNKTKVLVTKNRFSGDTGKATELEFSKTTGRLVEEPYEIVGDTI